MEQNLTVTPTVELDKYTTEIQSAIDNTNENANKNLKIIACALANIDNNTLYDAGGFKSTSEYAEAKFGYSKSNTSKLVRVANKYLLSDISKNFADYTVGQLQELLTVGDTELVKPIEPSLSAKQIREIVKKSKNKNVVDNTDNEPVDEINADELAPTDNPQIKKLEQFMDISEQRFKLYAEISISLLGDDIATVEKHRQAHKKTMDKCKSKINELKSSL